MKRSAIAFLLALFVLAGAFAGGKGEPAQPEEAGKSITFTTWNLMSDNWGPFYQEDFEQFEEAHPGFEIIPLVIPYEQYWDKVITLIASGSPPDVVGEVASYLRVFIDGGQLAPIDDLVDTDVIKNDYFPSQVAVKDGKYYGLNFAGRTMHLLYNTKMLNAAGVNVPTTHDELVDVSKKLTDQSRDVYGYGIQTNVSNYDDTYESIAMHVRSFGGRLAEDGKPTVTDPNTIEGFEYFKMLTEIGVTPVNVLKSTCRELFYADKLAMWIDGPWMVDRYVANNPGGEGVISAADNPWENKAAPGGPHYFFIVPRNASNKLGAGMYLRWTMRPEWHEKVVLQNGIPGGRKDSVPAGYLDKNPWFEVYLRGMDQHAFSVTPDGFEENAIVFMKAVNNALGRVLYENTPVPKAMEDLQKELEGLD